MGRVKWTEDKVKLVKSYVDEGLTIFDIAKKMGLTYKQIEHTINRYKLREQIANKAKEGIIPNLEDIKIRVTRKNIDELALQLGERMYENYKKIKLVEPKAKKCIGKREEVSILDISDVHLGMKNEVYDSDTGKKIVTYNEEIFKQELQTLQDSITEIHEILSHSYNLRKLVIFILGDILTNDRIFEEQIFEIEKVVGLQLWDAVAYFPKFFNNLLNIYQEIEIVCVVGNHGRSLPNIYDEPTENNYEYHLYKIWQKQFEDSKRIKVIVPTTRRYTHKILKWTHLIEHGDAISGFSETAIVKQIKELHLNTGGFDVFHMGHLHSIKEIEISARVIAKLNGAWIEKDNYAWKRFKTYSVPKQHFFGCNENRPETWAYKLDLRKQKR